MEYEITITKIEEVNVTKQGQYTVIDRVPWTFESALDERMYDDKERFLETNPLKEIRGYAPPYESTERRETEILKQVVEELDLAAVIKAINSL